MLIREIGKIGSNINQIARHSHLVGGVTRKDVEDLKKGLMKYGNV